MAKQKSTLWYQKFEAEHVSMSAHIAQETHLIGNAINIILFHRLYYINTFYLNSTV